MLRPLRTRLSRVLPTGETLPHDNWIRRHRQICILAWLHVPAVFVYGVVRGEDTVAHVAVEALVIALFAALAGDSRSSKNKRAAMATLALITASAVLVHLSGGLIEMHFHFFVMVVVVSLYQSWVPFLLAIGYVALHHGIVGVLVPGAVYNHPAAIANPWWWALIHALFVLGQSAACLVAWRVNEDALAGERVARTDLEQANSDLAAAQSLSSVGSWEWDVVTGTVWWSDELYSLTGVRRDVFTPSVGSFLGLVHPDDRVRVAALLETAQTKQITMDFECRLVTPDGEVRVAHCLGQAVVADDGTVTRMRGTCQDITERKQLEEEVTHRALHDPLTGLGNRALFLDRVDHALAVAARSGTPLAICYLDLDDFKTVNDSLGHSAGDHLLVEVARRLLAAVRESDTVARLGGDEFAVLLEDTDLEEAREVTDRIEAALDDQLVVSGKAVAVNASIGIAPASEDPLRDADVAMYAAKREGVGAKVFHPDMLSTVITRMELQGELRNAVTNGELVLHFQPVVDLDTGRVEAVEALVRWNHPVRGLLPPGKFIPHAEESGLIVSLGEWVMREATRQAKAFHAELNIPMMAVNLSPQQLSTDVAGMVRDALEASGLMAEHLVVEITETCIMSEQGGHLEKLKALRELGVSVAIDDFGTGYSSLSYLRQLPIDILKIDRSFVWGITDGPEESALAQAIIKLGGVFDLRTVAEGIETAEQAATLRDLGCRSGQGYLFCHPLPPDELRARLRGGRELYVPHPLVQV